MKGLRWFLAEFFVVVCGVIVAFAINSWWMDLKDQEREKVYLHQIHEDLLATESSLEKAEEGQRIRVQSCAFLVKALYSVELPSDSALVINMARVLSFDPGSVVSGTLSSFVQSGNLNLVVDDSLRSELVKTADHLDTYSEFVSASTFHWMLPSFERLSNEFPSGDYFQSLVPDEMRDLAAADSLNFIHSSDNFKGVKPLNWKRIFEKDAFKQALNFYYFAHSNLYRAHIEAKEDVVALKTQLERRLD